MPNAYLLGFKLLHAVGLKKASVRIARNLERYVRTPQESRLDNAIWGFFLNVQSFPLCQGDSGCYTPILSDDDPYHKGCREAQAEEDARQAELAAQNETEYHLEQQRMEDAWHLAELMDSFCTHVNPHCFEQADPRTGKCPKHEPCDDCGKLECVCVEPVDETWDDDDLDDLDECPGGCGNSPQGCTCAELASWRRHEANPATRGSSWVT